MLSVEPRPRGFATGRIVVDGRWAGAATGSAGGGGCTPLGDDRTWAGGRSSRRIDEKSKEALEVVSRRSNLEATKRAESARIQVVD